MTRNNSYLSKACLRHRLPILLFRYGASQTSGPGCLKSASQLRIYVFGDHNIRNGQPSIRLQYTEGLFIDCVFVGAKVDDAVGSHHIRETVWKLCIVQVCGTEFDGPILQACFSHSLLGPLDHLRRAIYSDHSSLRSDPASRQNDVYPAPTAEIYNHLARLKVRETRRVTTTP